MRQAALRTLLVVSERPHPWAFLRDRLDPELVTVSWARPSEAGAHATPWMLAGAGEAAGLAGFAGQLLCWRWVGPVPADLPAPTPRRQDWHQVAADAERALAVRLGGLRLAPGRGLILPDGAYLSRAAALEVLLAAHPDGLRVPACGPRLRAAVRRSAGVLRRHGLPLRVAWDGVRLARAETGDEPDGHGRPA